MEPACLRMRCVALVTVLLVLPLTGCIQSEGFNDVGVEPQVEPSFPIGCRVVDRQGVPITSASCLFQGVARHEMAVDDDGVAQVQAAAGTKVTIIAAAPEHGSRSMTVLADAPKRVTFTLPRVTTEGASEDREPIPPANDTARDLPQAINQTVDLVRQRNWSAPTMVTDRGNEPHLAVASDGTVYYSPTSALYRSLDGGTTWEEISPGVPTALPTLASDTSLSIAPDGSIWWSRYWGYAGTTIGCTSLDRGDTWTCDNAALPGVTDRMWVVGLDSDRGYLQTNEGLYHHVWASTDTGSTKYTPYATTTQLIAVRNGNMVYDEANDQVLQIEVVGDTHRLSRIDGATGLVTGRDTGLPATYALPWLAVSEGTLWTTVEPEDGDGTRSIGLARSLDGGAAWETFPVQSAAESITFSYVAAGPDGRVGAAYYGSDAPGPSTDNGGTWSLYVVETTDGLTDDPIWVETKLVDAVHEGNVCIGAACEETNDDPDARFSGDLIGAWIDGQGNMHVAYNDDMGGTALNQYVRQVLP